MSTSAASAAVPAARPVANAAALTKVFTGPAAPEAEDLRSARIDAGVDFFYRSANCTGPRYLLLWGTDADRSVVTETQYELNPSPGTPASGGRQLWGWPDPAKVTPEQFSYGSIWVGDQQWSGPAQRYNNDPSWDPTVYTFVPAVALDTVWVQNLLPPFCASATGAVQCR